MKSRLLCLIAFCILFIDNPTFSQTDLSKVIPPSPTAASLGKYGDFPVSTYNGTPNISIPLYEVKDKGLAVPVSLSYHASGIKVEDEASWVGLGWSLSAGGVITRSVRGVDDLVSDSSATGYPEAPLPTSVDENGDYVPPPGHPDINYFKEVCNQYKDAEPDIYYFNFLGKSGKFVFKQNTISQEPFTVQLSSQEKKRGHTEQMLEAAKQDVSLTITLGDKPEVITGRGDVVLTQAMNKFTSFLDAQYGAKRASGEIKKGQKAKDAFYTDGMKGFGKFWDDATNQVTKAIETNIKKEMDKEQEQDANRRAAQKLGEDNIQYNNGRKKIHNNGTILSN